MSDSRIINVSYILLLTNNEIKLFYTFCKVPLSDQAIVCFHPSINSLNKHALHVVYKSHNWPRMHSK
jgi:hypothetical protein